MLDALNAYQTKREWHLSDIKHAFCGFRPVINVSEDQPSKQSREEAYTWVNPSTLAVAGGKYTTYRLISKRCVDHLQKKVFSKKTLSKKNTSKIPFIGRMTPNDWPSESQLDHVSKRYHVTRESIMHLIETYGNLYKDILTTVEETKSIVFDLIWKCHQLLPS